MATPKKIIVTILTVPLIGFCFCKNANAVEKQYTYETNFRNRLVLSIFVGPGFPTGDFSSATAGNHEAGGVDYAFEFEWYFSKQTSIGLMAWGGFFEDKDFGEDLVTNLFNFGGFIKYTAPTSSEWYPYGKFGLGWTELEFEDPAFITKTDGGWGILVGGGVLYRLSDLISINGQLSYNHSFVENSEYKFFPYPEIGFDVQYIAIDAGISFYLGT